MSFNTTLQYILLSRSNSRSFFSPPSTSTDTSSPESSAYTTIIIISKAIDVNHFLPPRSPLLPPHWAGTLGFRIETLTACGEKL